MSILIKGMEMPKHCGECGIEWCDRWKGLIIAGMSIAKTRPENCPLIEVPPNGRLIDADALIAYCKEMQSIEGNNKASPYSWAYAYENFENDIEDAPTVIEAEECER